MPGVTSAAALLQAAADVPADALLLTAEPEALDAARRSLDSSGLLLLGEVHGVRENPMLAHALLDPLGVTSLALEWPEELAPVVDGFLATGMLDDHPLLWAGDGRITAGHLAMLAGRIPAGRVRLILFDGPADAYWSWTQQDEAMVRRLLAASPSDARTLVVAGNAHTPTRATELGIPMGAQLAAVRPGVREIRVRYCGGACYNGGPRRLGQPGHARSPHLAIQCGELVLTLPSATEAVVPHRPTPAPLPGVT